MLALGSWTETEQTRGEDFIVCRRQQAEVANVTRVVTGVAKSLDKLRREVRVEEQPHAGRTTGSSRSFTIGGVLERGYDVSAFEIRVVAEDVVGRGTRRELSQDHAHGDPEVANARQAAHAARVDGDPLECHIRMVRLMWWRAKMTKPGKPGTHRGTVESKDP